MVDSPRLHHRHSLGFDPGWGSRFRFLPFLACSKEKSYKRLCFIEYKKEIQKVKDVYRNDIYEIVYK